MQLRTIITATLLGIGATSVSAQSGQLPSTTLMKEQGAAMYGILNRMAKGEMPYDQAKVDEALAKLATTSANIPKAFPESSKGKSSPDTRYYASPKVWETRSDFEEYAANVSKAVQDSRGKVKNLDTLKAGYDEINDHCNGCHNDYRLRRG